jgi:hypothetical protein
VPHAVVEAMLEEMKRRQGACTVSHGEGEVAGQDCEACAGHGSTCDACWKGWAVCVDANLCEPPGALWAELRRRAAVPRELERLREGVAALSSGWDALEAAAAGIPDDETK